VGEAKQIIPKNTKVIFFILVLAALVVYYINLVQVKGPTTFDDAYMFIRYADNFLAGHGIAWNPDGVQTYGTTSILYLAIITLARSVLQSVSAGALLAILSASFGLPAIAILAYTCSRFASSSLPKNSFLIFAIIFTGYFVISPAFLFHMTSGMDTTLSFLCNAFLAFSIAGLIREKNKYQLFLGLSVLASYLAYAARPDNIFYVFVFPLLAIILLSEDDRIRRLVNFYGWLLLLLVVDTLVKFLLFGDPLPLSFYAKTSGYYEGYSGAYKWNPFSYLFEFGAFVLPFLVIIAYSASKQTCKLLAAFAIPVFLTFVYYFSVVQIMGFEARYYFPSAPFLIVVSFLMLDAHLKSEADHVYGEKTQYRIFRLAVIFLVIAIFSQSTLKSLAADSHKASVIASTKTYAPSTQYTIASSRPLPERGTWYMVLTITKISKMLPQGTTFAQSEYGYVGANAPNIQIIDIVGLHDPYFAHNGFSVNQFLERKPDLIWFPHSDYTKITSSIIDSKEFWEQYDYYPGAFDFGLAIRKDSPNYETFYNTVNKYWREVYETRRMKDYLATPVFK
jgi:hypothetical protein